MSMSDIVGDILSGEDQRTPYQKRYDVMFKALENIKYLTNCMIHAESEEIRLDYWNEMVRKISEYTEEYN